MTESEYQSKLDGIIKGLEKDLGKGVLLRSNSIPEKVDVIPTGIIGIDRALGIGGIPRGRFTEFVGVESSGKSTLALHLVAECQRSGGIAAYIDAEHALDYGYCANLCVQLDDLLISQPDSGEQALETVEALVRTGEISLVVIDSVASLVPKAELEGDMGQSFIGLQARLMSQAMRKLTAVTSKSNTAVVFINQIREKVGVMFGSPETQPGGRALKFYSSVRIDLRRGNTIDKDQVSEGYIAKIKVIKNKLASPYKQVEVPVRYGWGFDGIASLVDEAIKDDVIHKSGTWYTIGDRRFQGKDNLIEAARTGDVQILLQEVRNED